MKTESMGPGHNVLRCGTVTFPAETFTCEWNLPIVVAQQFNRLKIGDMVNTSPLGFRPVGAVATFAGAAQVPASQALESLRAERPGTLGNGCTALSGLANSRNPATGGMRRPARIVAALPGLDDMTLSSQPEDVLRTPTI